MVIFPKALRVKVKDILLFSIVFFRYHHKDVIASCDFSDPAKLQRTWREHMAYRQRHVSEMYKYIWVFHKKEICQIKRIIF